MNKFKKSAIEESILDIKLPKRPFICDCNRKHYTDSGNFDNRTESVSVVKTRNLSIIFGNKTDKAILILSPTIQAFVEARTFESK